MNKIQAFFVCLALYIGIMAVITFLFWGNPIELIQESGWYRFFSIFVLIPCFGCGIELMEK